ncbi:MAG: vWA domain-containing protein [Anaerolineae bacterium]
MRKWRLCISLVFVGLLVGLAFALLKPLAASADWFADDPPNDELYSFGSGPLNHVVYWVESYTNTCSALSEQADPANYLAAMALAPTFFETGARTQGAPSPMTLSRSNHQDGLYAFEDPSTTYQNAFWHPGVGMWQLDSAGPGAPFGAHMRIMSYFSAQTAAELMASRWCRSEATTPEGKRAFAWGRWHACDAGDCEEWFGAHYDGQTGELSLPNRDESVGIFGGMDSRLCRLSETGELFRCWHVDPSQAEGYTGWTAPGFGPSPLTAPFYVYSSSEDDREYRHWLKYHTAYDTGIYAWRPLGDDARDSLEWREGEVLCDETMGYGNCDYMASVDVVLIIDSSGSMSWNDPRDKRLDAAKTYVWGASKPTDYVGVVDFDNSVRLASPLLHVGGNADSLQDAIDTIDSYGGTNIGLGIQEGCNALIASASENTTKAAILLTDGVGGFNGEDACFSSRGWPIYTFGFGDADETLLQQIASNTGGEFKMLSDVSNLVCEFQAVRARIAGVEPPSCSAVVVGPGATVSLAATVPSGTGQASFATSWMGSDVVMTLTAPSGRVIGRDTLAPDVIHHLGATFETYTILNPEPGDWEVTLFGADVPPEGEEVVFSFIALPWGGPGPQPCGELYPIALHIDTIAGAQMGDELVDIYNGTGPGNFGWLSWTGDPSVPTLVQSLTPPGDSDTYVNPDDSDDHTLSTGDWVHGKPGVSNSKSVREALDTLKDYVITVPVWGEAAGQGNNLEYQVVGFARVQITDYYLPGQNRISAIYRGSATCGD